MKASARYVKIVEWSDEDQCFVGSCPGLLYGGCLSQATVQELAATFLAMSGVLTQRNPVWTRLVSGLTFMRALGR